MNRTLFAALLAVLLTVPAAKALAAPDTAALGSYGALLAFLSVLVPLALVLGGQAKKESHALTTGTAREIFSMAAGPAPLYAEDSRERSIGSFRIVRMLGAGSTGPVFEAYDRAAQRTVALRKVREEVSGSRREAARFLKEAKSAAALVHDNILRSYCAMEHPDGLFLAFEHVSGRTLDKVLLERKAFSLAEAVAVARQLARALDYAHARGVAHRDLKPSHILVAESGEVKIMDFAIARQVQLALTRLGRDAKGQLAAYQAPEVELGQHCRESDVFSLGACFYEMVAGNPPFPDARPLERKLRKEYTPLSQAAPGLPQGLDPVLERALEPSRHKRYRSAGEFVAALESLCAAAA